MCTETEEQKRNRIVTQKLNKIYQEEAKEIKILLLGAGGSGKSTIFKQMKIIHSSGYSDKERIEFKYPIYKNVLDIFTCLIDGCEKLNIVIEDKNKDFSKKILSLRDTSANFILTPDLASPLQNLWNDKGIQAVLQRGNELDGLLECASHFGSKVAEMCSKDYVPSVEDVLNCRIKTVGIVQQRFKGTGNEKRNLLFVDVGGQRNERRKWIHAFDGVTTLIFLVSVAGYNQKLEEDLKTNSLKEALKLFSDICNDRFFRNKPVIVFYNKDDLFREKIKKIDLKDCFSQYTGGKNYENAKAYIVKRFEKKNQTQKRELYGHFTTATNTQNVKTVFDICQRIILKALMEAEGFLQ